MFEFEVNRKMKLAWLGLSPIILIYTLGVHITDPAIPIFVRLAFIASSIIYAGLLIYVINAVRGSSVNTKGDDIIPVKLNGWSYIWRGVVAYFGQVLIILLFQTVLPIRINVQEFTYLERLGWTVPSCLFSVMAAWVFFSRDRLGQIRCLLSGAR